jgi:DNA-binding beta-propeller fold protein YncE
VKDDNFSASGRFAMRVCVREIVATNSGAMTKYLGFLAAAVCFFSLSGCGSKSTNTIVVTVSSSAGTTLLVGQSTTLTATVTGATNTNVNWQPCQFTTTTVSGTTTTTSTPATCPTDGSMGALSNEVATGTATYTAPGKVPDQTKFPGLQIVITAQSQQSTSKTGKVTFILNSGIGVPLNPTTATVATKEQQLFSAPLTNDLQSQGVTWLVTQSTPTTTITEPNLASCSPGCGTIQSSGLYTGIYTAPATVPTSTSTTSTPANVTVVATAKADNTRFATGTITIIQGGPITFNGISPTIAPQGAALWDIYLDAPNMSSASIITLTDQNGGSKTFNSSSGQIKVLFPIPTSTTANPAPIGARLRLLEADLALPGSINTAVPLTYTVSVSDPGEPVTKAAGGTFTFTLTPVRPTVVSTSPNGVVQGASTNEFPLSIDGGYFGPGGTFASVLFQSNQILQGSSSNSRRLETNFPSSAVGPPGLYPLSVSRTTPPLPNPDNPSVTTVAVFPDYSGGSPATPPQASAIAAGTNPSAIDIDPTLGIAVVAETGSNAVQFYSIGSGSLSAMGNPVPVGQIPTGVSVNRTNHSVAVVNYGSQSVSIVPIPGAPNPVAPATISLSGLLQGVSPAPLPYAIGVDPDTNLALVAYSSTSISSAANLGFVVNLNQGTNAPFGCLQNSGNVPPCVFSQVTLNTGAYPQIAMAPHGHLAFVTPGGSGVLRGVDVTQPSTSVGLSSVALAAGVVTATTSSPLTGTIPGMSVTVLISGVPTSNSANNTNFNGVFPVSVTSSTTFVYSLTSTASGSASGGTAFYGSPDLIFPGISSTTQGIAINPITHTAALADANATGQNGPQIDILNQLDQSVSSISFFATCTAFTISCAGSPELLHTADVSWQPYANSIVSYNPDLKLVSVSDADSQKRYAIVSVNGPSTVTLSTNSLRLWGGIAVDPTTNQAFVVESGSTTAAGAGQIEVINLGALKATQITEVIVPSPTPGPGVIGGIPKALVPQATLTSAIDLPGVQIFGAGFAAGVQVCLDGTAVPAGNVQVNPNGRQITVTVPASFLSAPHHYALDVGVCSGVRSNAADFIVMQAVDMTSVCSSHNPQPTAVAIAEQLKNGPFSPIAVVTNSNCNNISTIDINPTITVGGVVQPNPNFGHILNTIAVGTTPQGVAVSQRLGLAVVANNGSGNASIVNLLTNTQPVAPVTVGTNPTGVAINEATGAAIVANTMSNTVSVINLGLLTGSSPATSLTAASIGGVQEPIAIAIDPDRGTNNQGLAMVTGLQLISGSAPNGALYPVDIGLATPTLSTTISIGSVNSSPTGIVFDPAASTTTQNPGLFYVNSTGTNQITSFNPDNSSSSFVNVGINPTSLALNPQTGAILTANVASHTVSVVDTLSNPFRTRQTLGLPGSPLFGVAIDQFTNIAVVVDQANNRVFLYPMPN